MAGFLLFVLLLLFLLFLLDLGDVLVDFVAVQGHDFRVWPDDGDFDVLGACLDDFQERSYGKLNTLFHSGWWLFAVVVLLQELTYRLGVSADSLGRPRGVYTAWFGLIELGLVISRVETGDQRGHTEWSDTTGTACISAAHRPRTVSSTPPSLDLPTSVYGFGPPLWPSR